MTRRRWLALGLSLLLGALWLHDRGVWPSSPEQSAWVQRTAAHAREVTVEGYRLRVLDQGAGPAVLLLHGWCDSTYTWRAQLPRLSAAYRVIAFDWPGFGYSDKPARAVGYAGLARVSAGLLDQLGIARAFVVGNSMGGGAALHLAADFPDRVRGLVPVDAAAPMPRGDGPWLQGILTTAGVGQAALWAMGRLTHRISVTTATYVDARVTDEVLEEMYLPFNTPGARLAALRQFREIRSHPMTAETVARIAAPTLILWGREDSWIPLAVGESLARHIPGARLVVLDEVGHMPQWEAPEAVNRTLLEFFAEVQRREQAQAAAVDAAPAAAPEPGSAPPPTADDAAVRDDE